MNRRARIVARTDAERRACLVQPLGRGHSERRLWPSSRGEPSLQVTRRLLILVLAFASLVVVGAAPATAAPTTIRINGLTRFDTAAQLSKRSFPGGASTVV